MVYSSEDRSFSLSVWYLAVSMYVLINKFVMDDKFKQILKYLCSLITIVSTSKTQNLQKISISANPLHADTACLESPTYGSASPQFLTYAEKLRHLPLRPQLPITSPPPSRMYPIINLETRAKKAFHSLYINILTAKIICVHCQIEIYDLDQ